MLVAVHASHKVSSIEIVILPRLVFVQERRCAGLIQLILQVLNALSRLSVVKRAQLFAQLLITQSSLLAHPCTPIR